MSIIKGHEISGKFSNVMKSNVFVKLPTGFGKSVVFQAVPLQIQQHAVTEYRRRHDVDQSHRRDV